jgi:hypothetical protein
MRVVLWNEDRPRQAFELALLGLMDSEMAHVMNISLPTFEKWKRTKARFRKAIHKGKETADAKVVHSLYKRAVGYTVIEDHVSTVKGETFVIPVRKHIPGDVNAQIKWLASRQKGRWSELPPSKSITQHTMNILNVKLDGLDKNDLEIIRKIQQQLNQNNDVGSE